MKNRSKLLLTALLLIVLVKMAHVSCIRSNSSTVVFSRTDHKAQPSKSIEPFERSYHLIFHGLKPADNLEKTDFAIDVFVDKNQSVHSFIIPFFKRTRVESLVNYKWTNPLKGMDGEESGFFEIHVKYRAFGAHSENEIEQNVMTMVNEGIRNKISEDIKAILNP